MKIVASFSLDPEHVQKIDEIARLLDTNRSGVMRILIESAKVAPRPAPDVETKTFLIDEIRTPS